MRPEQHFISDAHTQVIERSDDEILQSFHKGEESGFSYLYNKYAESIYFFAWNQTRNKEAAEDITADTFMKVWKRRAALSNLSKIKPYLFQVARNACIDYYKRSQKQIKGNTELLALSDNDYDQTVLEQMIRTEFIQKVYDALNYLPPRCQEIFKGIFVEGKKDDEIARDMNIAVSTVRAQKVRGLQLLREKLIGIFLFILLLS